MLNKDLDKYNGYCMEFSNSELVEHLVQQFQNNPQVKIRLLAEDGEEINSQSNRKIEIICFDGKSENLYIYFTGVQTSIFVHNSEIMFIDELAKGTYTTSDTYHNVVFEGALRNLSHQQLLSLFAQFISCFIDCKGIEIKEKPIENYERDGKYEYYSPYEFEINVISTKITGQRFIAKNITINY